MRVEILRLTDEPVGIVPHKTITDIYRAVFGPPHKLADKSSVFLFPTREVSGWNRLPFASPSDASG